MQSRLLALLFSFFRRWMREPSPRTCKRVAQRRGGHTHSPKVSTLIPVDRNQVRRGKRVTSMSRLIRRYSAGVGVRRLAPLSKHGRSRTPSALGRRAVGRCLGSNIVRCRAPREDSVGCGLTGRIWVTVQELSTDVLPSLTRKYLFRSTRPAARVESRGLTSRLIRTQTSAGQPDGLWIFS